MVVCYFVKCFLDDDHVSPLGSFTHPWLQKTFLASDNLEVHLSGLFFHS